MNKSACKIEKAMDYLNLLLPEGRDSSIPLLKMIDFITTIYDEAYREGQNDYKNHGSERKP